MRQLSIAMAMHVYNPKQWFNHDVNYSINVYSILLAYSYTAEYVDTFVLAPFLWSLANMARFHLQGTCCLHLGFQIVYCKG